MTLCMAAVCYDFIAGEHRIAFAWDRRAENAWAGGNVAFKFDWAVKNWPTLVAGGSSKSAEMLATLRASFREHDEEFTRENIFDKFNEASCTHKEKLCRRYVRQQLGIDFERFLIHGEAELPPDVRARVFHEMGQLEFGGELLVFGFTRRINSLGVVVIEPHIIEIDRYGEVVLHPNFAAIGSGSVIANSTLYQREQEAYASPEDTLYHMYEAARLASASAPGVGKVNDFLLIGPPTEEQGVTRLWRVRPNRLISMGEIFEAIGPKPLGTTEVPVLGEDDLYYVKPLTPDGEADEQTATDEAVTPPSEGEPAQPSDSETSEGQP